MSPHDESSPDGGAIRWLDDDAPAEELVFEAPDAEKIDCWRCGKAVDLSPRCPHCGAALIAESEPEPASLNARRRPRRAREATSRITGLFLLYMAMLLTSIVLAVVLGTERGKAGPEGDDGANGLICMGVFELVDTALVACGLIWLGRPSPLPPVGIVRRCAIGAAAIPLLGSLLAINFFSAYLLRTGLGLPKAESIIDVDPHSKFFPWVVVLMCVQPAIVEELFFRGLALGQLRSAVGTHGAILISSVMFAFLHVFNPFGIPYLFLLGIVLGYVRVRGRSLAAPMLMHFAHNLVVILAGS